MSFLDFHDVFMIRMILRWGVCDRDDNSKRRTQQTTNYITTMKFLRELNVKDQKLHAKVEKSTWAPPPLAPTLLSQGFQQTAMNARCS